MFKNSILTALRNIKRHKAHSFINILGLSIGLACCILIFLWVHHEVGYDRFHENAERIFRIVEMQEQSGEPFPVAVTPAPLGPGMLQDFPEVINFTRFQTYGFGYISSGEEKFKANITLADPNFFDMFTFPIVAGDREVMFNDLLNVVISEEMAHKFFGDENPIGKTLQVNTATILNVTGVFQNVADNSHLDFDYIVPFEVLKKFGGDLEAWGSNAYYTYIQLEENVDWIEFDEKIEGYLAAHDVGYPVKLNLQPLKDIHLHSHYVADLGGHGDIIYVRIFSIIAAFILLIACINFMNLSTARAETRAREVGIKKVVGSQKSTLIRQFLGEAVILSFISLFFTIVMVELLLPIFNAISGKELTFFSGQGPWIYVLLLAITLFTGVFAGSYPAFILSSFKPINVLKGTLKVGKKGVLFRRLLVIIQFAITIIMIIGTLVVFKQVQFVHNKELGYTKEQILNFSFRDQTMESSTTLKNELLKLPQVLNVSRGSAYPYNIVNSGYGYDWRTKQDDERVLIHYLRVDYEFFETLDIKLAEGRTFSPDMPTDSSAIIINETAAALMGFDDPLSEQVTDHYDNNKAYNIIGVVKDFHFKKLQTEIEPLFISLSTQPYICFVRLNTEDIEGTLAQIKNIWNDLNPSIPFEYTFLDETYGSLYRAEKRMLTIFKYFTIMAIMISCLGLFGLISYMTQRRTREIGIRKVMGASVNNIVVLLTEESIKWVLIANIIAWPIAYFAMSRWLNTFVYKISLQSTYFILAGVLSMLIAIITISFQTLRAALRNPSEAMRYE